MISFDLVKGRNIDFLSVNQLAIMIGFSALLAINYIISGCIYSNITNIAR